MISETIVEFFLVSLKLLILFMTFGGFIIPPYPLAESSDLLFECVNVFIKLK